MTSVIQYSDHPFTPRVKINISSGSHCGTLILDNVKSAGSSNTKFSASLKNLPF